MTLLKKNSEMSNILSRREDSSKKNNLKIDEDINSSESNSSLAVLLLEGAQLIDIITKC